MEHAVIAGGYLSEIQIWIKICLNELRFDLIKFGCWKSRTRNHNLKQFRLDCGAKRMHWNSRSVANARSAQSTIIICSKLTTNLGHAVFLLPLSVFHYQFHLQSVRKLYGSSQPCIKYNFRSANLCGMRHRMSKQFTTLEFKTEANSVFGSCASADDAAN